MLKIERRRFNQMVMAGALSALPAAPVLAALTLKDGEAGFPLYDIAFSSWCFHMPLWRGEMKAHDLPGIARDVGVDALEWTAKTLRDLRGGRGLMFEPPPDRFFHTLRDAADDAGIQSKVMNLGGPFFLASVDKATQKKALDYIKPYIEPTQILGSKILRTELYYDGGRSPGWQQEARKHAVEGIRRLLDMTADSGLAIHVENHHGISSHPDWLASLVNTVDSPRFALTVDTNNFRIDQDNPYDQDSSSLPAYVNRYEGLQTLMPFARWVSAKCYAFDNTGYELSMDYPRILDIILASDYRGYISVEYEGAGDPLDGVRQGVEMFRALRSHFATMTKAQ